jgi:hypothetical protein
LAFLHVISDRAALLSLRPLSTDLFRLCRLGGCGVQVGGSITQDCFVCNPGTYGDFASADNPVCQEECGITDKSIPCYDCPYELACNGQRTCEVREATSLCPVTATSRTCLAKAAPSGIDSLPLALSMGHELNASETRWTIAQLFLFSLQSFDVIAPPVPPLAGQLRGRAVPDVRVGLLQAVPAVHPQVRRLGRGRLGRPLRGK